MIENAHLGGFAGMKFSVDENYFRHEMLSFVQSVLRIRRLATAGLNQGSFPAERVEMNQLARFADFHLRYKKNI